MALPSVATHSSMFPQDTGKMYQLMWIDNQSFGVEFEMGSHMAPIVESDQRVCFHE